MIYCFVYSCQDVQSWAGGAANGVSAAVIIEISSNLHRKDDRVFTITGELFLLKMILIRHCAEYEPNE